MKKRDLTDTKALDIKALKNKASSLRGEVADLRLDKKMNSLKDVKSISKKRKDLAQVLTILRQKELLEMLGKEEVSGK
jgi:ribosomal protein L29